MKPDLLKSLLSKRVLVLDGAMGTAIQGLPLTAHDFGGAQYEGCNENLVLTRPDAILEIHEGYLRAGCDIIETNTFGSTPLVLAEYELEKKTDDINHAAVRLARKACDKFSTAEKPRFVAGSIGPTTKAISVTGGITFEELIETFYRQAKGLFEAGADYLLLETCQDTRNIKAALLGIDRVFAEAKKTIPVAISGTIEPMGTMLAGQSVEALYASLAQRDLLYLGLNCATGPEFMTDPIRTLAQVSHFPVSCVPNAGLPDENGHYLETPPMMCGVLDRFLDEGWVNVIGGCCGTTPKHIEAFCKLVATKKPHQPILRKTSLLSGIDCLEVTDDLRPVLVGERTNVIGSRKFKKLICDEKFDEASEIARKQIKNGAQIIDVCLANPDRDENADMRRFLEGLIKKIKAPFMIDSTDVRVIEMALTYSQGKCLINSINLEDGEKRFEEVTPLIRTFGAAVVVGTIDEDPDQGMGVSRARKLQIAERSHDLLTNKYGINECDIYWDPLVFPIGTGDANYVGSGVETIEGIRLIKAKFPKTKTVLGISNVSFGLPEAGREVLNAVFLYHCVQAGLDLAIVNSERLERYASLGETERKLSEELIFSGSPQTLQTFADYFREKKQTKKVDRSSLPLDQRLSNYVVEGSKDGLIADLDEALKSRKPLEVINGPLMKGMDEVGRLFNENKLIVAEVLQSAEVMKAAVGHLENFMEKTETASRGKVLLATVKGDVHDIGKNLVEIIFSNNGFNVVNLGIKVPPEQLIRAIEEHKPDLVGLSGLLVKSAQQMVSTAEDFSKAGISTPILVGGAALSSNFVDRQIARAYATGTVAYAPDAMQGLELAKSIVDPEQFKALKTKLREKRANLTVATPAPQAKSVAVDTRRSEKVSLIDTPPPAPDLERHVWRDSPAPELLWNFINPMMLYGRHLGVHGNRIRQFEEMETNRKLRDAIQKEDPSALNIWETVQTVKTEYRERMKPRAVYQFFRVRSQGNDLLVYTEDGKTQTMAFQFPRQGKDARLCLSDYVNPRLETKDNVAFFIVTIGEGIRELAAELIKKGDYLKAHILQALALETAEAYAEYLHSQIRRLWGFPDAPDTTMLQRFQARYHGKRYSFGYPACPNLSDQQKLFQLLKPEEIGIQLTEGDMMEPEASVSAVVFHHPQASYFSVGNIDETI